MSICNKPLALLIVIIGCSLSGIAGTVAAQDISQRKDVTTFIDEMVKKHDFDRNELKRLFSQTQLRQKIIDAITRPAESKPWYRYRPIFVTDKRIQGGIQFWNDNQALLEQAEQKYGVPAEIITAIIGVESFYGKHKGGYPVMDSLATLAFDYPKRSKFFRSELEQFLLMTREEKMEPTTVMGSYAGAMGQPQFIASSFRHYAVDFDNDGKRDLWHNTADVIGSVANYFKIHGWKQNAAITTPVTVSGNQVSALVDKGIKPHTSIKQLLKQGVNTQESLPIGEMAALIKLENKDSDSYWLGLDNFYVITRYNHSPLYAMAVYQLGQEIHRQRKAQENLHNS